MAGGHALEHCRACVEHQALNIEERTTGAGVGHQALAAPRCGSISIGLGMLRGEKLLRGLRRGPHQALAQINVEAWPHEQTGHRLSSSLGDGGPLGGADGADPQNLLSSSQTARRKDCAGRNGPRPCCALSVYRLACRWPMAQYSGTAFRMKQRRLGRRICACWLTLCSRKLLRAAVGGEFDLELGSIHCSHRDANWNILTPAWLVGRWWHAAGASSVPASNLAGLAGLEAAFPFRAV